MSLDRMALAGFPYAVAFDTCVRLSSFLSAVCPVFFQVFALFHTCRACWIETKSSPMFHVTDLSEARDGALLSCSPLPVSAQDLLVRRSVDLTWAELPQFAFQFGN